MFSCAHPNNGTFQGIVGGTETDRAHARARERPEGPRPLVRRAVVPAAALAGANQAQQRSRVGDVVGSLLSATQRQAFDDDNRRAGLDVRAKRTVERPTEDEDVVVGIDVRGTLRSPETTIFATPAMSSCT